MDLNDYEPFACQSAKCRGERIRHELDDIYYYKLSDAPKICPKCGDESIQRLARVCLVYGAKSGKFEASERGKQQWHVTHWTYYCGRSNDEHDKHNICQHTASPVAATCPECLAKWSQTLELVDNLLRARS